jgi:hypothetical protein
MGSWIGLNYLDRVHMRERARRLGVSISQSLSTILSNNYNHQIIISLVRPLCCIFEMITGLLEGFENLNPIIKLSDNKHDWIEDNIIDTKDCIDDLTQTQTQILTPVQTLTQTQQSYESIDLLFDGQTNDHVNVDQTFSSSDHVTNDDFLINCCLLTNDLSNNLSNNQSNICSNIEPPNIILTNDHQIAMVEQPDETIELKNRINESTTLSGPKISFSDSDVDADAGITSGAEIYHIITTKPSPQDDTFNQVSDSENDTSINTSLHSNCKKIHIIESTHIDTIGLKKLFDTIDLDKLIENNNKPLIVDTHSSDDTELDVPLFNDIDTNPDKFKVSSRTEKKKKNNKIKANKKGNKTANKKDNKINNKKIIKSKQNKSNDNRSRDSSGDSSEDSSEPKINKRPMIRLARKRRTEGSDRSNQLIK